MRLDRTTALALALGSLAAPQAMAVPGEGAPAILTGGDLAMMCTTPKDHVEYYTRKAECRGYVTGVVDALRATGTLCVDNLIVADLLDAVRNHVAAPAAKGARASDIVVHALQHEFPCG